MKKLLTALILSTLVLSGCGAFRSHHAWKKAKQENPLEIPPGMDRPATTDALSIPPPSGNQPDTEASQPEAAPAPSSANATSMRLAGDVDTAYKRVGLALQQGDLGTVTAQDPAAHTYELTVSSKTAMTDSSGGFLKKHFSNLQQDDAGGTAAAAAGESKVTLAVTDAGNGASEVQASGNQEQAARIISALSSRIGG